MTLEDKRIVVLGGTSGIGFAVAEALVLQGANVVVASSQPNRVSSALERLGRRAEGVSVNLTDEEEIKALFRHVVRFDHLVVTAGDSVLQRPIDDTSLVDAKRFFGVRFWGSFSAIQHGHKHIRPGGSIVLTSSTISRRPSVGFSIGAGISAAIEALAKALAVELAPIRVNAVAPGIIRTEIWNRLPEEQRESYFCSRGKTFPVGRVGEPSEVAEAYLSFMRSPFTTGQTLVVDGGMLLV